MRLADLAVDHKNLIVIFFFFSPEAINSRKILDARNKHSVRDCKNSEIHQPSLRTQVLVLAAVSFPNNSSFSSCFVKLASEGDTFK